MGVTRTVKSQMQDALNNNKKKFSSRLAVFFAQSIEARCWVENEDESGAAPTGDAPATAEWPKIIAHYGASYIRDFTVIDVCIIIYPKYLLCLIYIWALAV